MLKLLIWVLLLAGFTIPLLLCISSFSIHRATRGIDNRYGVDSIAGTNAVSHDRFAYVEVFGQRISINPYLYPALLVLIGSAIVVIGLGLMMHANLQPTTDAAN